MSEAREAEQSVRSGEGHDAWLDGMNRTISSFARIARSPRLHRQMSEDAHAGLPQHLALVLYSIGRFDRARMSDLVDRMESGPSGISRNISELQGLGLVERTRMTDDRRAKTVVLTDEGARVLLQMSAAWNHTVERVTEHWTDEQRTVFLALFEDLTENLAGTLSDKDQGRAH